MVQSKARHARHAERAAKDSIAGHPMQANKAKFSPSDASEQNVTKGEWFDAHAFMNPETLRRGKQVIGRNLNLAIVWGIMLWAGGWNMRLLTGGEISTTGPSAICALVCALHLTLGVLAVIPRCFSSQVPSLQLNARQTMLCVWVGTLSLFRDVCLFGVMLWTPSFSGLFLMAPAVVLTDIITNCSTSPEPQPNFRTVSAGTVAMLALHNIRSQCNGAAYDRAPWLFWAVGFVVATVLQSRSCAALLDKVHVEMSVQGNRLYRTVDREDQAGFVAVQVSSFHRVCSSAVALAYIMYDANATSGSGHIADGYSGMVLLTHTPSVPFVVS
jgi:hypothetical protein